MNDKFRIAVVGLGDWARRAYLLNIELMDDVELASLCTRSDANMSAALAMVSSQPRTYRDYRKLIDDGGLDGIVVATAAPSHCEIAGPALNAGFPVLCEKPLALTEEDCDALAEAAKSGGVPLQVGLEFRHAPVLVAAARDIADGRIGAPSLVECQIFRDKRENVLKSPAKWTQYGGVFTEFLCHYFDVLLWFAQTRPTAVVASAGKRLGTDAWDHGVVNIEYENGTIATLSYALFACPCEERLVLRVLGDGGSLHIGLKEGTITYHHSKGDGAPTTRTMPDPGHPSKPYPGSYEQIRAFVQSARERSAPRVTAVMWKNVMAVGNAAREAAETAARVIV